MDTGSLAQIFNPISLETLAAGAALFAAGYAATRTISNRLFGKDQLYRNAASIEGEADSYYALSHLGEGSQNFRLMDFQKKGFGEDLANVMLEAGQKNTPPASVIMECADRVYIYMGDKKPSVRMLNLRLEKHAALWGECLDYLDNPEQVYETFGKEPGEAARHSEESRDVCDKAISRNRESAWNKAASNGDTSASRVNRAMLKCAAALALSPDENYSLSGACHVAVRYTDDQGKAHILVKPTTKLERRFAKKRLGDDELKYLGQDGNEVARSVFDVRGDIKKFNFEEQKYKNILSRTPFPPRY